MQLPNDLKFVNPDREKRILWSVSGELFFNKAGNLVAALVDLQKNPMERIEYKTGYMLFPHMQHFDNRLKAVAVIRAKEKANVAGY